MDQSVLDKSATLYVEETESQDEEVKYPWQKTPLDRLQIMYKGALLNIILEPDINVLKDFLVKNYDTMAYGWEIRNKVIDLIERYSLTTQLVDDMYPETLFKILEDFLENCERKFVLFDVSLEGSMLEGTVLELQIDESRKRISEYLQDYKNKLKAAEENVNLLHSIVEENARRIQNLNENYNDLFQRISLDDRLSYKEFYEEMQRLLDNSDVLNSTFEELAAEKRDKHILLKEICRLQELRILEEKQNMLEVSELAKDLQLDKSLTKAILEKINTITANPEEIRKAVDDWIRKSSLCIGEKEEEIRELKESVKFYDNKLVEETEKFYKLNEELTELNEKIEEETEKHISMQETLNDITDEIMELECQIHEKNEKLRYLQLEVGQLDQAIQGTGSRSSSPSKAPSNVEGGTIYSLPSAMREMFQELPQPSPQLSPKVYGDMAKFEPPVTAQDIRHYSPKSSVYQPDISDSFPPYSGGAKQISPVRKQVQFGNLSPISMHTTPGPTVSSLSDTSSSPLKHSSPFMRSSSGKETMVNTPRRALSSPSNRLTRDIALVDPTTQNINQVRNQIDVGKSFNMRTVCQTSTPYRQNTRVESILPESGVSGRMIDYPLNIKHTAELSPTQYVTPFISKTRFGYTDPTARVFNIPPGDDIDIPTVLRTSRLSTSPTFFDPSTRQQVEDVSSVITHNLPPSVTPTTTRRYGLFTPKGIFRKRHYNVRRLYRPEEHQSPELPWSPHYLPQDYRSPIRSIPSTPTSVYEDKSLSFEKGPDYSYGKSSMDEIYQASPIMNKTYRGATYATSRSPTDANNKNFNASTLHSKNRSFVTSPQTTMDKTFYVNLPNTTDRKIVRAPPFMGDRDRPFSGSSTDRSSATSPLDRTFSGSPTDRTSATSPLDRTFSGSPTDRISATSPLDRTFSGSPADRTSATSPLDRTFLGSPTDRNLVVPSQNLDEWDRSFSGSPTDRNFAVSRSYLDGRSFPKSPLHTRNRTF